MALYDPPACVCASGWNPRPFWYTAQSGEKPLGAVSTISRADVSTSVFQPASSAPSTAASRRITGSGT
ncbi:hypothetical protein EPAKOI_002021 [Cupriavidus sp. H18C2]